MALAPLLLLYVALAYALNSPQSEESESIEDCGQIQDTVHSEKLSSEVMMTPSCKNSKENVKDLQTAYVRWPLITGYYMFVVDNSPACLVVLLLQPYLGSKYAEVGGDLVLAAFVCTSIAIISSRMVEVRRERGINASQDNRRYTDSRQNLTGYCVVLTLSLILILFWISAQHYSLAFPIIILIVPTVCVSCLCGVSLDVLCAKFMYLDTRKITDAATDDPRLDKNADIDAHVLSDTNRCDVSNVHSGKEKDAVIDAEIDIADKVLTCAREEDAFHRILEDSSLSMGCTQTMDTTHGDVVSTEAGRDEVAIHQDQVDVLYLSMRDADQHGSILSSQPVRIQMINSTSIEKIFVADSGIPFTNRRKRFFSICVLVILYAASSPLSVQIILFLLKSSSDSSISPTFFSTSTSSFSSAFSWSHMYAKSSMYLRGFLLDWIEPEVLLLTNFFFSILYIYPDCVFIQRRGPMMCA